MWKRLAVQFLEAIKPFIGEEPLSFFDLAPPNKKLKTTTKKCKESGTANE